MKAIIKTVFLVSLMVLPFVLAAQFTAPDPEVGDAASYLDGILNVIGENWGGTILTVISGLYLVAQLTPTQKDNEVIRIVEKYVLWLLPDLKKGGGRHMTKHEAISRVEELEKKLGAGSNS